ncbi:hypothetical protein BS17DRAFT_812306 [Gyrodon lividus]|nr:hypothetical protein BS17DRAFT_812306 [Gyrodon lividus]
MPLPLTGLFVPLTLRTLVKNTSKLSDWDNDNNCALGHILLKIDTNLANHYQDKETAAAVWSGLETQFSNISVTSIFMEFKVMMDTTIPENQHSAPTFSKMTAHFACLKEFKYEVPDKLLNLSSPDSTSATTEETAKFILLSNIEKATSIAWPQQNIANYGLDFSEPMHKHPYLKDWILPHHCFIDGEATLPIPNDNLVVPSSSSSHSHTDTFGCNLATHITSTATTSPGPDTDGEETIDIYGSENEGGWLDNYYYMNDLAPEDVDVEARHLATKHKIPAEDQFLDAYLCELEEFTIFFATVFEQLLFDVLCSR